MQFYRRVDKLDVIILRPFNIFGTIKKLFLIPKLINQIRNKEKIYSNGYKTQKRLFIY